MGGKIKKFFLNFNRFNKPAVLAAVLFFIFLGLALPLQFVQAQLGLIIGTAVAVTIINLVLQLVLVISNLILGLAGVILSWVLSPYFMSLPYTYGGIVDVGWPIVRDFINMFFIIALVIIGLATALRIKEYQAQKTLPLLIVIAILINFTPVICGVILDASNILMNFFLEELTGFKMLGNMFSAQGTMLLGALQHFYNPLESLALMGKTLVMIIFDWIAAFIFFMFALLFVMRYVMIWVLVIVSPIAFFSRIFPASQRYLFKSILGWDEWWKQFIEWSIIGIVATFFIYLAEQLMVMAPGWIPGIPPGGVWGIITTPLVDFINNLLPWGVMLAFLIIGFFVATSTSAMGAGAITSWFKEKGVGIAKGAGRGVAGLAKVGAATASLRYLGRPAEALARRMERVGAPWAGEKGIRGMIGKGLAPVRIAGAQLERAPAALKERMAGWIDQKEKDLSGKSAKTQATEFVEGWTRARSTGIGWDKAVGATRAAIKDGNLGDVGDYLKEKGIIKEDEEMKSIVQRVATEAAKSGRQKEILQTGYLKDKDIEKLTKDARLSPTDLEAYGLTVSEEDKKRFAETKIGSDNPIWTKIMTKLKRNQMGHVSKPIALKDEDFAEILHKFGTGEQVGGLADIHGREFLDRFREEVLIRRKANPNWYKDNNPKMHKYLTSSPARGLGVGFGVEDTPNVVTSDLRKILKGKPLEERRKIGRRISVLKGEIPPAAAAPPEEERPVEEWPKAEKGMPKDIKSTVKEGQKYIETLGEKIKGLEVLNKSIEELKRDLTSLKEKTIKTPTDEELIRRMEVELLPAREEESRLTQESISDIRSRLGNLRERIKPWEEHKRAVEVGEKEEKRVKGMYKRLEKEIKKKK